MTKTVAITGASGYLGTLLRSAFAAAGWSTVGLVRSPANGHDRLFQLGRALEPGTLDGVDLLVHAAYDLGLVDPGPIWSTNVGGTELLLDAARDANVSRVIVISSMSAYPGTRQLYGRAKLEIERLTADHGGVIVRPGIVVGDPPGGMAGSLAKLLTWPITPTIGGAGRQFVASEEDITTAFLALADASEIPLGPIGLAHEVPVTFDHLLDVIDSRRGAPTYQGPLPCQGALLYPGPQQYVRAWTHRRVPVPWPLVYWSLRLTERLGLRLPFRSDSLLGLIRPAPYVPGVESLTALGLWPLAVMA